MLIHSQIDLPSSDPIFYHSWKNKGWSGVLTVSYTAFFLICLANHIILNAVCIALFHQMHFSLGLVSDGNCSEVTNILPSQSQYELSSACLSYARFVLEMIQNCYANDDIFLNKGRARLGGWARHTYRSTQT